MKLSLIVCMVVGTLLLATMAVPNVRASGSIVYTSTTDFDGGNKSDPGNEFLSQDGVDSPFYNVLTTPNAQYVASLDRTYITYMGGNGYLPYVTYYDHTARTYAIPVAAIATNPQSPDGHSAPSMIITPDGFIHVFCCAHFSNILHQRSTNPYDISTWIPLINVTTGGTYPSSFYYSNLLYIIYRNGPSQGPGLTSWDWRTTSNGGVTWSAATKFIDLTDKGVLTTSGLYINRFELSGSKMWYSFQWLDPDATPTSLRRNVYVAYWDLTTNNQHNVSGFNMGTSVNWTEAETYAKAVSEPHIWTGSIHLFNGNPYVIYNAGRADYYTSGLYDGKVNFTRWTGSSWTAQETITTTDESSNYIDSITNSTGIEAFLTTSGISGSATDVAWRYSGDIERWTWTLSGGWIFRETLITEGRGNGPVNFPTVPVPYKSDGSLRVLFAQFGRDILKSESKIYAWGSNGLVFDRLTISSTFGVDTTTTNNQISNGTFQLANGFGDTFVTNHSTSDNWKFNFYETGDSPISCSPQNISSGKINWGWSGTGAKGCGISNSWVTNSGDWIETVKFTDISVNCNGPPACIDIFLYAFNQSDRGTYGPCCPEGFQDTTNGVVFSYTPVQNRFRSYTMVNGGLILQSDNFLLCSPICYMRINHTQSTATYVFSHSTDGTSYVVDSTVVSVNQAKWHFFINAGGAGTGISWTVNIDEWNLTGATSVDAYRPSGKWVSPPQTYTGEVAKSIVVGYSGATSTKYIDEIAVVDSQGNVLFADGTNRISGTSANFTIGDNDLLSLFGKDWSVRVTLAGDGTGSVTVNDVTVYTVRSTLTIAISDAPWIVGFLALIALGLAGALVLKKKRGG